MFITVYQDPEDKTIHAFLQETMPVIPEDYQKNCNLVVFNTSIKFPNINTVLSRASVIEALGGVPIFGDDTQSAIVNPGLNEDFGIHLRPVYENYDL